MIIDIITLFPSLFNEFLNTSIIKRAIEKDLVKINIHNLRDYSLPPHHQVDDYPFGGGAGMVLMCEPIFKAVENLKKGNTKVILTAADGVKYTQKKAYELNNDNSHLIIICGHYEGVDERIKTIIDYEISIGDYVLTGGEIPAMVITDSITRLIKGVIKEESHLNDSFNNNLLDYPNYTKPRDFRGLKVPEVLLNGNHQKIAEYRKIQQIQKTKEQRIDLLEE